MPSTTIDDLVECEQCGEPAASASPIEDRDLCASCADVYVTCVRCDRWTNDPRKTLDGAACPSCVTWHYEECEGCGWLSSDTVTTADGTRVCDGCSDNYWSCDGCGELIDSGDYCSSCQDEEQCPSDLIHDYTYKPLPEFHGSGSLHFGIELEVSAEDGQLRDSAETAVHHLGGVGYLKADCSINYDSGYGFEIVTHPMSYDWAIDHFPWHLLTTLERSGCEAEGNGLHVHISRAGFDSPSHVYRWMKFLYRCQYQVTTLARRVSDQWAAFDESDRRQVKKYAKGAHGYRYRAINTQNAATFELRIFASSLRPEQVKAALGLAAASVEYTRTLTVTDIVRAHGWDWSAFASWVHQHPAYGPLLEEMEQFECAC